MDRNRPLSEKELHALLMNDDEPNISEDNMQTDEETDQQESDSETSDVEPYQDSGSEYEPSESSSEEESDEAANNVDQSSATNRNSGNENDGDWTDTEDDPFIFPFTGVAGLKKNFPSGEFLDVFLQIFDENLIAKIVNWTNERANKFKQACQRRKSSLSKWEDTDIGEMKCFLALCILMGNVHMPSIKSYWRQNPLYLHPIFGKQMSRNRFELLMRCVCFYSDVDDQSSKLHKIDQVLDHLLKNIKYMYAPSENLSLDEALLLWRGRLSFRQYIPNKAAKYGIKFYELCTPDGFVLNTMIYCGKGTVDNLVGHANAVVSKLMEDYLGKGHTLFVDNFYTSIPLCSYLLDRKTHLVGTLRANRKKLPTKVIKTKLQRGGYIWQRRGNILVLKWKDKRDVLAISTKHKANIKKITNKRGVEKEKPELIHDYNQNMSGIDRTDQMVSYYVTARKSIRWYMKVFFHLLDVSIWNSCWLYNNYVKSRNTRKLTYLEAREKIIESFLVNRTPKKKKTGPEQLHFPKRVPKRKRCRECYKNNKKRQMTWYVCSICMDDNQNEVGLCADPCFKKFHCN